MQPSHLFVGVRVKVKIMIRVGFVFNHSDIIGGGELSFIELAGAIHKFDIEPIAIVPGKGEVQSRLDTLGIEIVEMSWPPIRIKSFLNVPQLIHNASEIFHNFRLNLIHVNGARCMLYAGPAARRINIPCIWHVRVLERDYLFDRLRERYASIIIANSKAVAKTLSRLGLPSKKIEVVYNGLGLEKLKSSQPLNLASEFHIPDEPVVLAMGRFTRWKGFEDLIHACKILKEKSISFSCLLIGEALPDEKDYEFQLRELVRKLELTNVFFTGWRNDISSIMKSASVLVVPSHSESFGRVIIEAWACGLPVIATNEGGPAEIITNGTDGLLVKTGDKEQLTEAIIRILCDITLAIKLRDAAYQKVLNFTLEKHAEQIANIYKSVLH